MAFDYVKRTYRIKGTMPSMQHNGRLSNPLDPFVKRIKPITGKKNKTDEDHLAISDLEFEGGLYLDDNDRVCWPPENILAMLITSAKFRKMGKKLANSLQILGPSEHQGMFPLNYEGPRELADLKADPRFRDIRSARVGQSRVMRTRPIFRQWSLEFWVLYLADQFDPEELDWFVANAGRLVGLSEYPARYGRFIVTHIDGKSVNGKE